MASKVDIPSLKEFFLAHGAATGKPRVIKPYLDECFKYVNLWMMGRLPEGKRNLSINIPPRHGKTFLARDIIAYSMGLWPDSEFIYVSYAAKLAVEQTKAIRSAMNSQWYQTIWPWVGEVTGQQDHFGTKHGGKVFGCGVDGPITGMGAGRKREEFGGAIVCFPYTEKVWTDRGLIEIGEIVEKRMDVSVYSFNLTTNKVEIKPVCGWHRNPASEIIEVVFNDGASVRCTPDHRIWTDNRGWVSASELESGDRLPIHFPDVLDGVKSDAEHLCKFFPRKCGRTDKPFLFISKFNLIFPWMLRSRIFRYFRPRCSGLNLANNSMDNAVSVGEDRGGFIARGDLDSLFSREFCTGSVFKNRKCAMPFGVCDVFASRPVGKVIQAVIGWISIKMSNLATIWARANKGLENGTMHGDGLDASGSKAGEKTKVTGSVRSWGKYFGVDRKTESIFSNGDSSLASDSSQAGSTVKAVGGRYRTPIFIRHDSFSKGTYCVSIKDNSNFYAGERQAILVSNCDDILKASDARSEVERTKANEWYTGALLSRKNSDRTPILNISQRLHPDDLVGHLKANEAENWYFLETPAVNEEAQTTIWPDTFSYASAMKLKAMDEFAYYSQYQQQPIIPGGSLIKAEWWDYFSEDIDTVKRKCQTLLIFADTAYTAKNASDYSVIGLFGLTPDNLYILDLVRGKWQYEELLQQVIKFWEKHSYRGKHQEIKPVHRLYIEDKASGLGLLGQPKLFRKHGINAFTWNAKKFVRDGDTTGDKVARVNQAKLAIYDGRVLLPDDERITWVNDLIAETSAFNVEMTQSHDDITDVVTMGILTWEALMEGRH